EPNKISKIRIGKTSSRYINFAWTPLQENEFNGPLDGYVYQICNDSVISEEFVERNVTSANATNLLPYTYYTLKAAGFNRLGDVNLTGEFQEARVRTP